MPEDGPSGPDVPRTFSPIEQFGQMKQRNLEEYRNSLPDTPENRKELDFLSQCRVENIDITGVAKLRELFSSPEKSNKITHLPCLICPGQDGKVMTLPLVPIHMNSTDNIHDKGVIQLPQTSYIIRTNPFGDAFLASYFSDTACEEYFGLVGSTLPGYLLTEDEAFYLWNCGGLDLIRELLSDSKLGWYFPSSDKVVKFDEVGRTWIAGTANERKCISFGDDVQIGISADISATFGYPLLFGSLDIRSSESSSTLLQEEVGDIIEKVL